MKLRERLTSYSSLAMLPIRCARVGDVVTRSRECRSSLLAQDGLSKVLLDGDAALFVDEGGCHGRVFERQ